MQIQALGGCCKKSQLNCEAVVPYFVGILIHKLQVTNNHLIFNGTIEQNSMRGGLLFATIFPIIALIISLVLKKYLKNNSH